MSKLFVIGTAHEVGGLCNPSELYKIIKKISPEVVFCEISPKKFPQYLSRTDVITPELETIKELMKEEGVKIIPIDVDGDPFDNRLEKMFDLIKQEMPEYQAANRILIGETILKGFPFLNSEDSDKIFRDKNSMEKYFVHSNKEKHIGLINFYAHWLKWNDLRENHWINLIENHITKHNPKSAVFLVGAGHRFRLMDKLNKNKQNSKWIFPISNKTSVFTEG